MGRHSAHQGERTREHEREIAIVSKIGFQSGGAVINQLGKLCDRYPVSIKLYGLALNLGIAQFIHDRGVSLALRNIGRGLDYGWDGDIVAKANAVADAHIAVFSSFLPFDPWVECHNEPPTWDSTLSTQENIDRAKRGNEWQVIVADRMHAAGFRHVLAYSFSVGTPKSIVYGDALNMWPYYQDGIAHCDGLALHEYWLPKPLPQLGLTFRYRTAYQQMLVKRPIMLTELGLGFDAGYQATTNLDGYLAQLDQYDTELMRDNYLLCAHLFILSSDSAQWTTWDVQNDSEYESKFIPWLGSGTIVAPYPSPSPSLPPEPNMITPAQIIATMPFLVKRAIQLDLGPSIYGEYDAYGDDETYHAWIWQRGGVIVKDGNYGSLENAKLFHPVTGEPMSEPLPWPYGGSTPPTPPKRLTTADLPPEYGIVVNSYIPKPGEKFFGLVGAGNFKSGSGVGTQTLLMAVNESGSPVIGFFLTHAWDTEFYKSETFPSPTVGIILSTGSYYTPPALGPDRFYVSKGPSPSGAWPTPYPSDVVIGGMPGGQHFEAQYTWQLMTG